MRIQNGKKYNEWEAYGQVKTANMLYSLELAERLKSRNILSFSLHPGGKAILQKLVPKNMKLTVAKVIMGTNLGTHLDQRLLASLSMYNPILA